MEAYDIAASYFILIFYIFHYSILYFYNTLQKKIADQDALSLIESLTNIT